MFTKRLPAQIDGVFSDLAGVGYAQRGESAAVAAVLAGASFPRVATLRGTPIVRASHFKEEAQELVHAVRAYRREVVRALFKHSKSYIPSQHTLRSEIMTHSEALRDVVRGGQGAFLPRIQRNGLERGLSQIIGICRYTRKDEFNLHGADSLFAVMLHIHEVLLPYRTPTQKELHGPVDAIATSSYHAFHSAKPPSDLHSRDIAREPERVPSAENERLFARRRGRLAGLHQSQRSRIENGFIEPSGEVEEMSVHQANTVRLLKECARLVERDAPSGQATIRAIELARTRRMAYFARNEGILSVLLEAVEGYQSAPSNESFRRVNKSLDQAVNKLSAHDVTFKNITAAPLNKLLSPIYNFRDFCRSSPAIQNASDPRTLRIVSLYREIIESEARWEAALTFGGTAGAVSLTSDAHYRNNVDLFVDLRYAQAITYYREAAGDTDYFISLFKSKSKAFQKLEAHLSGIAEDCRRREAICVDKSYETSVKHFGGRENAPVTPSLLSQITQLQESVLVDPSGHERQSGLYSIIPESEIGERFYRYGAVAHCIYHEAKLSGVCILCPNQETFPPLGRELQEMFQKHFEGEGIDRRYVLVDLAVQRPSVFGTYREVGKTPHYLMQQQLGALVSGYFPHYSTVTCMAICRLRPIENASLQRFLEEGWYRIPGVEYQEDGCDYAVVGYDYRL